MSVIPLKTALDKTRAKRQMPTFGQRIARNSPAANLPLGSVPAQKPAHAQQPIANMQESGVPGNASTDGKALGRKNIDDIEGNGGKGKERQRDTRRPGNTGTRRQETRPN